jgi:hypothetical protein
METRSEASLRKELDELREHLKQASEEARQAKEQATQAQEQATIARDLAQQQSVLDRAKIDDLELALRVASLPSLTSPVPNTNLLSAITAVVPIDEQRLNAAITTMSQEFEGRLNNMHNDLLQHIQALITSNVGTNVAPIPTGPHILPTVATVSTGPQTILPVAPLSTGLPIPSFNMAASTTSPMILPASTAPVPNVATVLPGPHISFNLAACQSNAKTSQCQFEPELSQSVLNIPAESTSPSSSQRADREQASAQAPRIERVGEYSNENTPSSPPQTENFVKRRLDTKRGRVRFNTTWSRDNCSPDHFISFMNTNLRCAIT